MAFVVTENCRDCRFTHCIAVCPAGCFHMDEKMVYIDPDDCIDCGACVPECPVDAIWNERELPPELAKWADLNRAMVAKLPRQEAPVPPLPSADARRMELGFSK
jgi:ferredoxin